MHAPVPAWQAKRGIILQSVACSQPDRRVEFIFSLSGMIVNSRCQSYNSSGIGITLLGFTGYSVFPRHSLQDLLAAAI